MQDTVYVVMWRRHDGVCWNEIGAYTTQEQAEYSANELKLASGLQTSIIVWNNSPFIVNLKPHKYEGLGNTICGFCGHTLNNPIHK